MATSFDVVEDLGLAQIDDYVLAKLFNTDFNKFQKTCDSFLVTAVPLFTKCRQSLKYNLDTREFVSDLTDEEIAIKQFIQGVIINLSKSQIFNNIERSSHKHLLSFY